MKAYNIYYNNERINTKYLSKKDIDKVLKEEYIYKKRPFGRQMTKIPTSQLKVVMCTLVG